MECESQRRPGRPREQGTDEQIIEATLRLMAQHGYSRMSVEMVAAEAGVTKPTIYRRYKSKEELAVAALATYRQRNLPVETGDTRTDLIAQLRHFKTGIERPFGMAMIGTVLAEEFDTPELLASFRTHIVQPRRQALRQILAQARTRGELKPEADIELAVNLLIGSYYAAYLAATSPTADWPERVTDLVLAAMGGYFTQESEQGEVR
jgi:AcrR family transcriptional regulator